MSETLAQRRYRLNNPEKRRAVKEAWRKKNLHRWVEYNRKWKANNPEEAKLTELRWVLKNPHKVAKKSAARKARIYQSRREPYDRVEIYQKNKGICCVCSRFIGLELPPRHPQSFTIQHHIPLSRGGADAPDNLGIAHYSCNSRVGNRMITA